MDDFGYIPNIRRTLYDRVSSLLESVEWSDCSFLVGSEIKRAHKLILAISSPVFKVMLYGPLAESSDITISDIEPHVFQLMLDFIYRDKVTIDSLENACGLLYAAKKYMLPYLIELCVKYISHSMSIKNVLSILPLAEWLQEDSLVAHCITLICKHSPYVLNKDMDHIPGTCLQKILQQNAINTNEKRLIELTVKWAHDECLERDLPPSDSNKRMLLVKSGNFELLRFLTLTPDELEWLSQLSILSKDEKEVIDHVKNTKMNSKDVRVHTLNSLEYSMNLTTTPREAMRLDWLYCYRPTIRTASPLIIESSSQNIKVKIKSRKTIFINSLSVPTRQSPEVNFPNESSNIYLEQIDLTIYSNNNVKDQISTRCSNKICYNTTTYLDLPRPFIFNEEEWYTVSFTWPEVKSPPYKYPLCYRPTMSSDDIYTFDDNFENTMPCGSFVEGLKFCV